MAGKGKRAAAKAEPEIYQQPKATGPDQVQEVGNTGRTVIRHLTTLEKLYRDGKVSGVHFTAGLDAVDAVHGFYGATSGMDRLSEEAPSAGGDTDPIRLYAKARAAKYDEKTGLVKGYIPTQRPRNVSRAKSSFDGWNNRKLNALKTMHRLRTALRPLPAEALLAFYGLVIHPSDPGKRSLSLSAYAKKRYGHDNARITVRVLADLAVALEAVHREYGDQLEEAA